MPDTSNIIDSATASTILKWAVTILIAGFIAQFGKKFATYLMEKARSIRKGKKEAGEDSGMTEGGHREVPVRDNVFSAAALTAASEKARLKLEKKKLKASMKEQKK